MLELHSANQNGREDRQPPIHIDNHVSQISSTMSEIPDDDIPRQRKRKSPLGLGQGCSKIWGPLAQGE